MTIEADLDRVLVTVGPAVGAVAGMLAQRRVSRSRIEGAAKSFRRAADMLDQLLPKQAGEPPAS